MSDAAAPDGDRATAAAAGMQRRSSMCAQRSMWIYMHASSVGWWGHPTNAPVRDACLLLPLLLRV